MQLVLHKCHDNPVNLFNQVCVVALEVIGSYSGEKIDDTKLLPKPPNSSTADSDDDDAVTEKNISDGDGEASLPYNNDASDSMFRRVEAVVAAKMDAVKFQNYSLAKQIKLAESQIRDSAARCARLAMAKNEAVVDEDYDRASMIKAELDNLTSKASSLMDELKIEFESEAESATSPEVVTPRRPPKGENSRALMEEVEANVMAEEDSSKALRAVPPPPRSPRLKKVMNAIKLANSVGRAMRSTVSDARELVELGEGLPAGWVAVRDEESGYPYYYNEGTGESSWEVPKPEELVTDADADADADVNADAVDENSDANSTKSDANSTKTENKKTKSKLSFTIRDVLQRKLNTQFVDWNQVKKRITNKNLYTIRFFFIVPTYLFLIHNTWMAINLDQIARIINPVTKDVIPTTGTYLTAVLSPLSFGALATHFSIMIGHDFLYAKTKSFPCVNLCPQSLYEGKIRWDRISRIFYDPRLQVSGIHYYFC